jgi:hypothetical protein
MMLRKQGAVAAGPVLKRQWNPGAGKGLTMPLRYVGDHSRFGSAAVVRIGAFEPAQHAGQAKAHLVILATCLVATP